MMIQRFEGIYLPPSHCLRMKESKYIVLKHGGTHVMTKITITDLKHNEKEVTSTKKVS